MKADEFKINDKVWDLKYGWGIVEEFFDKCLEFYVVVKFNSGCRTTFNQKGETGRDMNRTLFFEEVKISDSAYKRPKWRAKSGDIYCHISGTGLIMHSTEYNTFENDAHCNVGNYFKTEEDAKESKFYKVFHEEE